MWIFYLFSRINGFVSVGVLWINFQITIFYPSRLKEKKSSTMRYITNKHSRVCVNRGRSIHLYIVMSISMKFMSAYFFSCWLHFDWIIIVICSSSLILFYCIIFFYKNSHKNITLKRWKKTICLLFFIKCEAYVLFAVWVIMFTSTWAQMFTLFLFRYSVCWKCRNIRHDSHKSQRTDFFLSPFGSHLFTFPLFDVFMLIDSRQDYVYGSSETCCKIFFLLFFVGYFLEIFDSLVS